MEKILKFCTFFLYLFNQNILKLCTFINPIIFFFVSQELETIEEQWHNETKELRDLVNRLQDENRRMKQTDNAKALNEEANKTSSKGQSQPINLLNESDYQKLQRLRGQMEKQRDELMCRDQEIEEKNSEIENVCFTCFDYSAPSLAIEILSQF